MNEQEQEKERKRGWVYRLLLLGLIAYVAVTRPDHFIEWVPVIIGLGNGLATLNTSVKK